MQLSGLVGDLAEGVKLGEEALLQPGLDDALSAEIHNEQADKYVRALRARICPITGGCGGRARRADRRPRHAAQALASHLNLEHFAGESRL